MPREGIDYPGWWNRAACSIRCELSKLWSAVGSKVAKLNTVEPDGDGKVNVVSDTAALIVTDDQGSNAVRLSLDPAVITPPVQSVNAKTGVVVLDAYDIKGQLIDYNQQTYNQTVRTAHNSLAANVKNADDALDTRITAAENAITTETNTRIAEDALLQSALNGKADTGDSYTKQEADARFANTLVQNSWAEENTFNDDVTVNADLDVSGDVDVDGQTDLDNTNISGTTKLNGSVTVQNAPLSQLSIKSSSRTYAGNNNVAYISASAADTTAICGDIYWRCSLTEARMYMDAAPYNNDGTAGTTQSIILRALSDGTGYLSLPTVSASTPTDAAASISYLSDTSGSVNNLIHTSGYENRSGTLNMQGASSVAPLRIKGSALDITSATIQDGPKLRFSDMNDNMIFQFYVHLTAAGVPSIRYDYRKSDGTIVYGNTLVTGA